MISKNRLILIFAGIFLVTCFLSGCSIGSNNSEPSATAAKTNTADANDTSDAVIKDKIEHKEYISKSSLGSVAFKIDESNSVTKEFLADGSSTTLELTDKSGIKWTLTIPEDALLYPQTITMTALSDISSSTFPSQLTGGVRFAPDGLQFLKPAVLTVYSKNTTGKSLIFQGNDEGSELDYAYMTEPEDSAISSYIFHFSSAFISENPQIQELYKKALKDYEEAVKACEELMKEPIEVLPPPSYDYRCKDKEALQKEPAYEYFTQLKKPEGDVLNRYLGAKKALAILGSENGDLADDVIIQKLGRRQLKKLDILIKTYKYQSEKCYYATNAITGIVKEGIILGYISDETAQHYISIVGNWFKETRDHYLSELKTNHDYKAYSAAMLLTKYASLLMSVDGSQAIEEINNAMSFKLYFETEYKDDITGFKLHGEIPIKVQADFSLSGTGTGHYDSYVSYNESQTEEYLGPFSFSVNSVIDAFKPCEDSIDILVDKFGSEKESFLVTTESGFVETDVYDSEQSPQDPTAHTDMVAVFYDYADKTTGNYRFHLKLNNLSADAVDQTVGEDDGDGNYGKIHFKLVHEPK